MKPIVDDMCVLKHLCSDEHHRGRQVAGDFLYLASERFTHCTVKDGNNIIAFSSRYGSGKCAAASVAILVGEECPYLTIAHTRLVQAHIWTDIGCVEIEPAAQFLLTPLGISAYLIAIQLGKMFAIHAVHLRYVLNRQSRRLNLHLLKKPRTRR